MLLVCFGSAATMVCQEQPPAQPSSDTSEPIAISPVSTSVTSYDPASINLGIGAILPRDRPYQPLTGGQRYRIWYRENFLNPQRYTRSVFWSIMDVSRDRPPEWGSGVRGFSQRYGSRFARSFISTSIEDSTAAALGYDVRYISSNSPSAKRRLGHAVLYRFITLNRDGKRVFNLPQFLGTYGSEMLATKWTPREKWSAQGLRSGNEQMVFGVGMNILKEFLPDLKRKLKKK